ncbi:helix-turn-helix domain-containing protein [Cohnella sp. 56]|uniref:helix-turn-helix domain-containing protein n=1 Tax=Cohnella sp. 56 TaxID=3113722 RepID=UPI0030E8BE67
MSLGTRLRERRERLGKTQLTAARELGISNVQLSRYESDDRKPEPDMLGRFAEYYRTTADYLLGLTNDATMDGPAAASTSASEAAAFEEFIRNPEHGLFFKDYLDAPEARQEEMLRFWTFLREQERLRKPDRDPE